MELNVNVPNTYEVNFERIVATLKERGHFAYVEHTGGGCATIYAGPTHQGPDGESYYKVAAGPGFFVDGSLQNDGMGDTRDLVVGPDGDYDTFTEVPTGATESEVVALIERYLNA